MQIMRNFTSGVMSVIKVIGSPMLYRYPYRTSAEGLHTDWMHIGKDIESVMGKLSADKHDG
jgi:hypothetical protein